MLATHCNVTPVAAPCSRSTASPACSRAVASMICSMSSSTSSKAAVARRAGRLQQRQRQGLAPRAAAADGGASTSTSSASDLDAVRSAVVYRATTGEPVTLGSLWSPDQQRRVVVALFTHFADLSSVEFAQKLLAVLPELQAAGVTVISVGLGEAGKARRFCELTGWPADLLYAEPTPALYTRLGFNPGFAPDAGISAYAKLLVMLAGIGSEGTIAEVLRGYVGDRSQKPVFTGSNPFDILGANYQRPFELATLRLYNMNTVLSHWGELCPSDEALLTLQGGCLVFDGKDEVYRHADSGILKYANVDDVVRAALPPGAATSAATQVLRPFSP